MRAPVLGRAPPPSWTTSMRRSLLLFAAGLIVAGSTIPEMAAAQRRPNDQQRQEQEAAKKKKRDSEWNDIQAPLPQLRNAGPCPYVKVLYDAARYIEFKDEREASNAVGWSGEIQGISAGCQYKDEEPIRVTMEVLFELGRGPQAQAAEGRARRWPPWAGCKPGSCLPRCRYGIRAVPPFWRGAGARPDIVLRRGTA